MAVAGESFPGLTEKTAQLEKHMPVGVNRAPHAVLRAPHPVGGKWMGREIASCAFDQGLTPDMGLFFRSKFLVPR